MMIWIKHRHRPALGFVVLFSVFLAQSCASAATPAKDPEADIDDVARKLMEQPLLHSTSIGIVYRGTEFIRHHGEMETGKLNPPTDATIYEIGSLSKTLAGTLMANAVLEHKLSLEAVLEHKLSLEDDVQMYLAEPYPNLRYEGEPIRIRHLLSHTSGLPNMLPDRANTVLADFTNHSTPRELNTVYANYGKNQFLEDLHSVEIRRRPGKEYSYSSSGTELSAHILERIYGSDYESLLRRFFKDSAAMANIKIRLDGAETSRLAVGYHSDNDVPTTPMPQLPWGASGNAKATVPDMMKYVRFQLAGSPVVTESHRPLVKFDDKFSIGYFWNIISGDKLKGTYYAHHGGVPRSQCYIYIVPKYDLGAFIITNQSGDNTARAMEEALDALIEKIAQRETSTVSERSADVAVLERAH